MNRLLRKLARLPNPDEYRWWTLATYNAEVARGILHTETWKQQMREQQKLFDQEHKP